MIMQHPPRWITATLNQEPVSLPPATVPAHERADLRLRQFIEAVTGFDEIHSFDDAGYCFGALTPSETFASRRRFKIPTTVDMIPITFTNNVEALVKRGILIDESSRATAACQALEDLGITVEKRWINDGQRASFVVYVDPHQKDFAANLAKAAPDGKAVEYQYEFERILAARQKAIDEASTRSAKANEGHKQEGPVITSFLQELTGRMVERVQNGYRVQVLRSEAVNACRQLRSIGFEAKLLRTNPQDRYAFLVIDPTAVKHAGHPDKVERSFAPTLARALAVKRVPVITPGEFARDTDIALEITQARLQEMIERELYGQIRNDTVRTMLRESTLSEAVASLQPGSPQTSRTRS